MCCVLRPWLMISSHWCSIVYHTSGSWLVTSPLFWLADLYVGFRKLRVTYVSISVFLQVLGRPATLQSTFSPLLVDGLPEQTDKQNKYPTLVCNQTTHAEFVELTVIWPFEKFYVHSGVRQHGAAAAANTYTQYLQNPPIWKYYLWFKNIYLTIFIRQDTYFTVVSWELSPAQGITSVSVYLRIKIRNP